MSAVIGLGVGAALLLVAGLCFIKLRGAVRADARKVAELRHTAAAAAAKGGAEPTPVSPALSVHSQAQSNLWQPATALSGGGGSPESPQSQRAPASAPPPAPLPAPADPAFRARHLQMESPRQLTTPQYQQQYQQQQYQQQQYQHQQYQQQQYQQQQYHQQLPPSSCCGASGSYALPSRHVTPNGPSPVGRGRQSPQYQAHYRIEAGGPPRRRRLRSESAGGGCGAPADEQPHTQPPVLSVGRAGAPCVAAASPAGRGTRSPLVQQLPGGPFGRGYAYSEPPSGLVPSGPSLGSHEGHYTPRSVTTPRYDPNPQPTVRRLDDSVFGGSHSVPQEGSAAVYAAEGSWPSMQLSPSGGRGANLSPTYAGFSSSAEVSRL
eukprot:TRINITY_DN7219_c0_g1_i3.p1 TRINITY_DN7219_c0_g1~~TRINITY_DN7219_c0_g1_i3.p1  ORF type:complete len:403 (+),score=90.55 TRINITY_DN7219_c0_g1_i3:81-1211(+)